MNSAMIEIDVMKASANEAKRKVGATLTLCDDSCTCPSVMTQYCL